MLESLGVRNRIGNGTGDGSRGGATMEAGENGAKSGPTPPDDSVDVQGGIVASAGRLVAGAAMSFHPASMPVMTRRSYRLELTSAFFFAVTLSCVEGGIVSVFTKNTYEDVVPARWLNLAVAIVGAAPEIANIISFGWSQVAHGRAKVPLVNALQLGVVAMVLLLGFLPASPAGLWMLVGVVLVARVAWSGIITIRPTIWKANYGREVRARVIGKISGVTVVTIAGMGIVLGLMLDHDPSAIKVVTPIAAACGLLAFFAYRGQRVRRHGAIVKGEREDVQNVLPPWMGPMLVVRVLKKDKDFAGFMVWMFVLGFSNIMIGPMLTITLKEQFGVGYLAGILMASSIPALMMFLTIPLWARVLGRAHVVRFRAYHSWIFVVAGAATALGAYVHSLPLMFVGAALQGVGYGGGTLAWNLGHVDFAPPTQTSQYMATHVTLNGLRGLMAPFAAVALYSWIKNMSIGMDAMDRPIRVGPDASAAVFAIACVLAAVGAAGFGFLYRSMGAKARTISRGG
jgi:Major Facilitator Superfamily